MLGIHMFIRLNHTSKERRPSMDKLNYIVIGIVLVAIVCLVVFLYYNKRDLLYKAALFGVATAEEAWGSGMGRVKFAEVYTYLKKEFPVITVFFSESQLSAIIEEALAQLKEILATKIAKEELINQDKIINDTIINNTPINIEVEPK